MLERFSLTCLKLFTLKLSLLWHRERLNIEIECKSCNQLLAHCFAAKLNSYRQQKSQDLESFAGLRVSVESDVSLWSASMLSSYLSQNNQLSKYTKLMKLLVKTLRVLLKQLSFYPRIKTASEKLYENFHKTRKLFSEVLVKLIKLCNETALFQLQIFILFYC